MKMRKRQIKTIDVDVKEWFDRINGNSYFAGYVTINYGLKTEQTFVMPYQYGYGNQYEFEALQTINKETRIKLKPNENSLSYFCRENNIILRTNKQENCLKKELLSIK